MIVFGYVIRQLGGFPKFIIINLVVSEYLSITIAYLVKIWMGFWILTVHVGILRTYVNIIDLNTMRL